MRFTSLFVLSSLIVSGFATPAADFVKQIKALSDELSGLTTAVNAVPATNGLAQAGTLPSFSKTESSANLAAAKDLEVITEDALKAILAKKAAFNAIGVLPNVRGDVKDLGTAALPLVKALIDRAFKPDVPDATALRDKLSATFNTTIKELN
ncbi:hypothetical protein C0991_005869 [Blastosporella zonata]|nr:hypothetical protein C0991_005869 [Blastosporella zonata]